MRLIESPRRSGKRLAAEALHPWLRHKDFVMPKLTLWQRLRLWNKKVYIGVDASLKDGSTTVKWKYLDGKIVILSVDREQSP